MDPIPFSEQVLSGQPLLIITPYGISITEMINIIIESLRRSRNFNINLNDYLMKGFPQVYIDREYSIDEIRIPIYRGGSGIVITTTVLDEYTYNPGIIPIYIIEWGIREHTLNSYWAWLNPINPIILTPVFLPTQKFPVMIPHFVGVNDNKINEMVEIISSPSIVIVTPDNIPIMNQLLRRKGIPVYNKIQNKMFLQTRYGVLLTSDLNDLKDNPSEISVHIQSLDSDNGMQLLSAHNHDVLHIYIKLETSDMNQYNLLTTGIDNSNRVYNSLIEQARILNIDTYNNLYVQ